MKEEKAKEAFGKYVKENENNIGKFNIYRDGYFAAEQDLFSQLTISIRAQIRNAYGYKKLQACFSETSNSAMYLQLRYSKRYRCQESPKKTD